MARRQRRSLTSDRVAQDSRAVVLRMGTEALGVPADLEDTTEDLAVPADLEGIMEEDLVGRAGREVTAVLGEGPRSETDIGGGKNLA